MTLPTCLLTFPSLRSKATRTSLFPHSKVQPQGTDGSCSDASSETQGQLVGTLDDGIFMGESLQQERESPWALTLTKRVPEAFEFPPSDWPEKYFSGQSAKRNSRATLMSSYTRLFSSSNAVVAWPVKWEHF